VGGIPVDIKCSWAGSVSGIQTLVQNRTDGANTNWLNAAGSLTTAGTSGLNSGPYDAPVTADVAMSDTYQGQTPYAAPALTDKIVGVVPWVWVRNAGSPAGMTNMTSLAAQLLLGAGQIPVAVFTGNTNDTDAVSLIGRDEDAGARLVAFAEPAFGAFGAPLQFQVAINGVFGANGSATNTVTGLRAYPVNTILGVTYPAGHSGYASGGTVAGILATPGALAAAGTHLIGYAGISDATTATNANTGAAFMSYNGVSYSPNAVRAGKYTFWSYEHLLYRSSLTGGAKTVADQIADAIKTLDPTPAGIQLSTMGVNRQVEGGVVSP
jgi:hypothetical protein